MGNAHYLIGILGKKIYPESHLEEIVQQHRTVRILKKTILDAEKCHGKQKQLDGGNCSSF